MDIVNIAQVEPTQIYDLYVNSFKDPFRDEKMTNRLKEVGVSGKIYQFTENDPRSQEVLRIGNHDFHAGHYGNFYSMMRIIEDFYYHSDKEYAVILEHDVFLKKSLAYDLPKACLMLDKLNLDVLLIGMLLTCSPEQMGYEKVHEEDTYKYYNFPDDLWGSHGFIINKKHAKYFIDKYTLEEVAKTINVGGDWIFTKIGKKLLQFPPLVVEEGEVKTTNFAHIKFHLDCRNYLYNSNYTS